MTLNNEFWFRVGNNLIMFFIGYMFGRLKKQRDLLDKLNKGT